MVEVSLLITLGLIAVVVTTLAWGSVRWKLATNEMRAKLGDARRPLAVSSYNSNELPGLPAPVRNYFRAVLKEGQPMVTAVSVEHSGTFNMGETVDQWKQFRSTQRVVTRRVGFDWDARIRLMPGLSIRVHDAYIAGEGILHASLAGLMTMVNLHGTPEVAEGELMRFLAEAAWYPTALLPSQGISWEAVDESSAKATLGDGNYNQTLLFRFDKDGLIESVHAVARGRMVGGKVIPTPWVGRWGRYELHDGMLVPTEGEVAWMLPEGPKPYWRGRITRLLYEFAD